VNSLGCSRLLSAALGCSRLLSAALGSTSISSVTVSNSISREPLFGPMYGASGPSISLTESPISSSSFSTGSHLPQVSPS